jgi:hypothetical protein
LRMILILSDQSKPTTRDQFKPYQEPVISSNLTTPLRPP